MHARRRLVTSLGKAVALALSVAGWVALAPTQLGGQASYLIVAGNSMEPGMHRGDLAVVRRAASYREGDVVTYRHPDIGPVIHRIIGREGDRYVFKGDHNSFVDGYKPQRQELVGKLWIRFPSLGGWLAPLRSPRNIALLVVVAIVGLGGGIGRTQALRRRGGRRDPAAGQQWGRSMNALARNWQDTFGVMAIVAMASLLLAIVAYGRPLSRSVTADVAYRQAGEFSYTAEAPDAGVYDNATPATGDPIFRRLSNELSVRFTYRLSSEKGSVSAEGSYRLVAEVGDINGWKRTIELQPETPFTGSSFEATGTLSLTEVQAFIDALEEQTGVHSPTYSLAIATEVKAGGTVAGQSFAASFKPRLAFKLDSLQAQLPARSTTEQDPLKPVAEGLAHGTRAEANTVPLLFLDLKVSTARWLGTLGVAFAVAAAAMVLIAMRRWFETGSDPALRIKAKYGQMLVTVSAVSETTHSVVDVASIEDLARLAEREGCPILQEIRPGYHAYFVQLGDTIYRWQAVRRTRRSQEAA